VATSRVAAQQNRLLVTAHRSVSQTKENNPCLGSFLSVDPPNSLENARFLRWHSILYYTTKYNLNNMKAMVFAVSLVLMGVSAAYAQKDGGHKVTVIHNTLDVLYLKVSPAYVGAWITVFDSNGAKVKQIHVTTKKILVDFFDDAQGDYLVHIEKGGFQQDVKYHKA
jgi:hypothetical protein